MRFIFTLIFIGLLGSRTIAQVRISGTVLDVTKKGYVEGARVISTGGEMKITDSLGRYTINSGINDSLYFIYGNKPTQKFSVKQIANINQFDISLKVMVPSKYNVLKEVIVYSKSYQQDSIENRENYAKVFGYTKPGLSTNIGPQGAVGADVNELINIFRFKRNKRLKAFRGRLEEQEQEQYITYRFNKIIVRRITQLTGPALDTFLVKYRPSYEFAAARNEIQFNQYILQAFYQFKRLNPGALKLQSN